MSKGKIILQDITNPVEGMKVYWVNDDNTPKRVWAIHHIDKYGIGLTWVHDQYVQLSELKQLAVEYNDLIPNTNSKVTQYTLPLHPDDYEVVIGLIGQEVEFTQHKFFYEDGNQTNHKMIAKLSLPTPVRTIEDIPEELRKNYTLCQYCDGGFFTKDEENFKVFCSNCAYEDTIPVEETWDDIHNRYKAYANGITEKGGKPKDILFYQDWLKQHYLPPKRK